MSAKKKSNIPADKLDLYDKLIKTNPRVELQRYFQLSYEYIKQLKPKPTKKKP